MKMQLSIHDRMTLGEVSSLFQSAFPYLKLCFYKRPKSWTGESYLQYQLDDNLICKQIIKRDLPILFNLDPNEKTLKFEIRCKSKLSLNVQVFRKWEDRWIQSEGSDLLTLQEQNDLGKRDSNQF